MTELPTRAAFEQCRSAKFRVDTGSGATAEFELVEVRVLRPNSSANGRPFALLFHGPTSPVLAQKLYPMEHDRLGSLTIFVVPVGQDATAVRYEAVFN
jgi:hypothetical protein